MKIKISQIKEIRKNLNLTHIVIFGVDESGKQHIATHGKTRKNAKEAAEAGNRLKKILSWPDVLCHEKPLERKCKNCIYFRHDYGVFCSNGWSGNGSTGKCIAIPDSVVNKKEDDTCVYFEPKL